LLLKPAVITTPVYPLTVQHVKYSNVFTGADLQNRHDCSGPGRAVLGDIRTLDGVDLTVNVYCPIDVTAQVQTSQGSPQNWTEIDGSSRVFQIRMMDSDADVKDANHIEFYEWATAGNQPELHVYYRVDGVEARGFTSFDLASVTNITTNNIVSVKMKLYGQNVSNTPSAVTVDHVNYGATPLGTNAYNAAVVAGQSSIGSFNAGTGWAEVDVTYPVKYAMKNSKGFGHGKYFQARLRPSTVSLSDYSKDLLTFAGTETAGLRPYLEVTYLQMAPPPSQIVNTAVLGAIYSTNVVSVLCTCGTIVSVSKTATNTTLKGIVSAPKPGATVNYRIICSNKTTVAADDLIVYDRIDNQYVAFATNSAFGGGWTVEYSTNLNPVQTLLSPDYNATQPSPDKVRWIRFRTVSMPGSSSVLFRYNVKIR
jgi:hypothetical protein